MQYQVTSRFYHFQRNVNFIYSKARRVISFDIRIVFFI